jgi:hypothetical protein
METNTRVAAATTGTTTTKPRQKSKPPLQTLIIQAAIHPPTKIKISKSNRRGEKKKEKKDSRSQEKTQILAIRGPNLTGARKEFTHAPVRTTEENKHGRCDDWRVRQAHGGDGFGIPTKSAMHSRIPRLG